MSHHSDWKLSLTSIERYDNIQNIQKSLDSSNTTNSSGFTLESEAFQTSTSRDEYDLACARATAPVTAPVVDSSAAEAIDRDCESPGLRVGHYSNCHYVASGVTAAVYKCQARALKVIVDASTPEPHNAFREAKILGLLQKPCIPLLETFRDHEQRFVLVFPFMPLTLAAVLDGGPLTDAQVCRYFNDIFLALAQIHRQGIVHRDIKPSAILLESQDGPAYLSDFGTAWQPDISAATEPPSEKILDIGTGPYRAPEVLFGNRSYGPPVDMWGAGAILAECCRRPPKPLFESRAVHEDGNQLGLILSIFKTVGSPTVETWPEAASFKTPPFAMYQSFEGKSWSELLPDVGGDFVELVSALVRYDSSRATAQEALEFKCLLKE